MREHQIVDYDHFVEICCSLLDKIKKNRKKYSAILCPLRGGFYLSNFMSRHLNLPIFYIDISSYSGKNRKAFLINSKPEIEKGRILICDDIYDTGNTLKKIRSLYPHIEFDAVFLASKKKSRSIIYGLYVKREKWLDFFWEIM